MSSALSSSTTSSSFSSSFKVSAKYSAASMWRQLAQARRIAVSSCLDFSVSSTSTATGNGGAGARVPGRPHHDVGEVRSLLAVTSDVDAGQPAPCLALVAV